MSKLWRLLDTADDETLRCLTEMRPDAWKNYLRHRYALVRTSSPSSSSSTTSLCPSFAGRGGGDDIGVGGSDAWPDFLVQLVLACTDARTLLRSAERVCRQWRRVSAGGLMWTDGMLRSLGSSMSLAHLHALGVRLRHATRLVCKLPPSPIPELAAAHRCLWNAPSLRTLWLCAVSSSCSAVAQLLANLGNTPSRLEQVTLNGVSGSLPDLIAFVGAVTRQWCLCSVDYGTGRSENCLAIVLRRDPAPTPIRSHTDITTTTTTTTSTPSASHDALELSHLQDLTVADVWTQEPWQLLDRLTDSRRGGGSSIRLLQMSDMHIEGWLTRVYDWPRLHTVELVRVTNEHSTPFLPARCTALERLTVSCEGNVEWRLPASVTHLTLLRVHGTLPLAFLRGDFPGVRHLTCETDRARNVSLPPMPRCVALTMSPALYDLAWSQVRPDLVAAHN